MSTTLKNPPTIGQVVWWIEPEEYRNPDFVRSKREQYPGELRVVSVVKDPRWSNGNFQLNISHDGATIPNQTYTNEPAIFGPHWFHWDGE
jgi:hypothetical protein